MRTLAFYQNLALYSPYSACRLWDLAAGKTMVTLTHHKKSVRALAIHPTEYTFASASAGGNNIKKWKCPEGMFVFNFSGHNAIINTLSVNSEGVFFSGGDNGTLTLWDWNTGTAFQNMDDIPQPGSLEAEAGVFCSTFDMTGTRLITGGADKTIKVCHLFRLVEPSLTHGPDLRGAAAVIRCRGVYCTIFGLGICIMLYVLHTDSCYQISLCVMLLVS